VLVLEIMIHLDAVGRGDWSGAPDERPLTELGRRQAEEMAAALGRDPIGGLFSSPARRCVESLEPLARHANLPIEVVDAFRDTGGYQAPPGWGNAERAGGNPLGGALAAGSAFDGLRAIEAKVPNGRAVLCSYGDIVPALLAFLCGAYGQDMPSRDVANRKGTLFRITVEGEKVGLEWADAPSSFPR
jgi:8-oxo-dGTP diphosphatase